MNKEEAKTFYLPGNVNKLLVRFRNFLLKFKLLVSLTSITSSFSSFLVSQKREEKNHFDAGTINITQSGVGKA